MARIGSFIGPATGESGMGFVKRDWPGKIGSGILKTGTCITGLRIPWFPK